MPSISHEFFDTLDINKLARLVRAVFRVGGSGIFCEDESGNGSKRQESEAVVDTTRENDGDCTQTAGQYTQTGFTGKNSI